MSRDDFPESVKRVLAVRAAHFCSNPSCRKLTAGPHSNPEKALQTGHAAHIHAASAGGPRFRSNQTKAERRGVENGIWMCRECGDLVDKDEEKYPSDLLRKWKFNHEESLSEIRTAGYSKSIELMRASRADADAAREIIAAFADRRSLWEPFDAEFPDRVRISLDMLRERLCQLKGRVGDASTLEPGLDAMITTIIKFFRRVEGSNLATLRCDSNDIEWVDFRDSLTALRKSIGYQIQTISKTFEIQITGDLLQILPTK